MAGEPRDVVAAVRPRRREMRAHHRVDDEQDHDKGHDPARRPARGLQDQHDEGHAENLVPHHRGGRAIAEIVAPVEHVADDHHAEERAGDVPPHDAVAEAGQDREHEKRQEEGKPDVHRTQDLRRHDRVGRIQVKERHDHRNGGQAHCQPARELVGRALFLFDELLGLFQGLFADDDIAVCRLFIFRHIPSLARTRGGSDMQSHPSPALSILVGGPGRWRQQSGYRMILPPVPI